MEEQQSRESLEENTRQNAILDQHEERIKNLEQSTAALLESNAALNASVEQTNKMLKEGFDLMKKLAVGIVGTVCAFLGVGSQTGMV